MTAALDHLIVFARDRAASAAYLASMLGAATPTAAGHFTQVQLDNGLTVDFMDTSGEVAAQHYAFLVDDVRFDAAFARIRAHDQGYWADPYRRQPKEINPQRRPSGLLRRPERPFPGNSHPPLAKLIGLVGRRSHAVLGSRWSGSLRSSYLETGRTRWAS